ncbi:rod-binding protein, partial [Burkholderia ambifaria]
MAANLPDANDLTQRFALDVQGFDALRAQARQSPQAGAKAVAGQFDAMFTQMMLKSMRDATPDGGLLDSHTSKMYTSMLDQQLAQQMSKRGIGVADALMKQLMRNAGQGGGTAADAGAAGLGAAGLGAA